MTLICPKIQLILVKFTPGTGRDRSPMHNVPILLSFVCLLVREHDIDLSKDTTDIGEIYTRMVRCLYRKYTIRKGIEYKVSDFINLLKSLGKLALETLLSENPLLKQKEVIAEVGEEAFDYGLLIGHEDAFRFIPDETSDIFVTFPHRSILEFLGSFCFVWRLNEGESIEDILGTDNQTPIFLTNPLFLQFCLWFVQKSGEMFAFLRKQELYKSLVVYAAQKVDHEVLLLRVITNSFSALDNFPVELFGSLSGGGQNEALLNFFGDILSEYRSAQHLVFDLGFPVDWVLSSVETNLKSLKSIEIERTPSGNFRFIPKQYSLVVYRRDLCARINHLNTNQTDDVNNKLIVVIHTEGLSKHDNVMSTCLTHCANIEKRFCVYVQFSNADSRGHELASFLDGRLDEVDLMGRYSKIVCKEELPLCPKLTHLSLRVIDLCDVVEGLSRAIQNSRFPHLSHVSLIDCSSTHDGALSQLFQTQCPTLVHLNLDDFEIDQKDLDFLSSVNVDPEQSPLPNLSVLICSARSFSDETFLLQSLFRKSWNQLKSFTLRYGRCGISTALIHTINEGKLPNLTELHMSLMWGERVDVGT